MADPGRLDELKRKFEENPKRYFAPLANEYRKAGDPELAIELCRTYLPQQPTHMSGYIVYGQALHDAGHTDESAAVFKQALTLDPENIIALRQLGDISRNAGDNVAAMRWYGKVLELDPRNEEIAAHITSLAHPGSTPQAPVAGRQPPPAVRPEPAPDESAVRLEDIVSEPDQEQTSFGAEGRLRGGLGESSAEQPREPFPVTEWPTAVQSESPDMPGLENSSPVLEGPWHSPSAAPEDTHIEHSAAALEASAFGEAAPVRLADFMPDEDSAFGYMPEELGESDAQPAEHAPAPEGHAAPSHQEDSPFVTETMAELYMQQGLRGEALGIYRQLALKRDDPALHQKIAEIESRHSVSTSNETIRAFFARIGARRPNERVEMAAARDSSLSAFFGSAKSDASDLSAAQRLSGAFGNPRSSDSHS